ncbi:MAG: APC family permease [Actinomycetota bacterium]|nr:APC family permease [Actinomycetota bacterium]
MSTTSTALKRILVGRPMSSGELEHTLLPKTIALPVFSSDALSSVAYATQEILLVLGLAGSAALAHVIPISLAVATLLTMVVLSYRQTVRAYPSGGGAYIVAHENLGMYPGLLAASALLIDYVLTVSVSTVAGVDAIISAAPRLTGLRVELCLGFVLLVALANLRGVRESGVLFAIPTYGFILSIYGLLITGFVKCLGGCPVAASSTLHLRPEYTTLSLFLVLRAFAAGTTALTGVEAISNGVPAFRYPQSKNAATTLGIMGSISISMFLGISTLAHLTHVHYREGDPRTVVAQIAHAVFAGGPLFYVIQVMTAAILILAANTAFADFPRLSSILARDRFMPRQFQNRGDRLVFSNGIVILTTLASLLVIAFDANLTRLIQLYLVGVFISFTLSQSGMVIHWRRSREPGWRRSSVINGLGALLTGVVLIVVVITKFKLPGSIVGAWIVIAAIPLVIFVMRSIHSHYLHVAHQLAHPHRRPTAKGIGNQHFVILVRDLGPATCRAIGYVRATGVPDVRAINVGVKESEWLDLAPEIDLIPAARSGGSLAARARPIIRRIRTELDAGDFLTVVIPEAFERSSFAEIVLHPHIHRFKASLLDEDGLQVLNVPVGAEAAEETRPVEPLRNHVCVLVAGVTNASLQAMEYAETLQPTDIQAVSFSLDPEQTEALGDNWLQEHVPHPLDIQASPFRDIGASLIEYIRTFSPDGVEHLVTVVLPEFVVAKRRHQLLHNQTALVVKRKLLFEPGVVVVSVPYRIEEEQRTAA